MTGTPIRTGSGARRPTTAPDEPYALWDAAVARSRAMVAAALAEGGADQAGHVTWPDEAYPMITQPGKEITWGELHIGARQIFSAAGFEEVSRPTARRVSWVTRPTSSTTSPSTPGAPSAVSLTTSGVAGKCLTARDNGSANGITAYEEAQAEAAKPKRGRGRRKTADVSG